MQNIETISARKVLDSRAEWTVEAELNGFFGSAPAGASKGKHEAKAVNADKAVEFINNTLSKCLIGLPLSQGKIDAVLGKNMVSIGENGATALSFAAYNCIWNSKPLPKKLVFPYPVGNVFGGGAHGGSIDIQEVLISPLEAKTFPEAIDVMSKIYHLLKKKLIKDNVFRGTNDEGALTGDVEFSKLMDYLFKTASANGCRIGLDMAASGFWNNKKYVYKQEGISRTPKEQIEYVVSIAEKYNLFYIEDPLHEEDFEGFAELKSRLKKVLIVGDDLTVTNTARLAMAIKSHSISSMIVKPNQVGSVTHALESTALCKKCGIVPVISHRSAETTDTTIARMALDAEIPLVKFGVADMRVAKLNKLLRIWSNSRNKVMAKV
ncbi:MAG: hypothetical protein KAJ91_04125 [Candidatus Aenigmarchaeota archaeon]|nr:hypothetical protein [Candidatus Aenigmarchaeota archaeon]